MKKIYSVFFISIFLVSNHHHNLLAQNNFVIGMYAEKLSRDKTTNKIITSTTIAGTTYYSSCYNVLAQDGFNTIVDYQPDIWVGYQDLRDLFTLIHNNNGMKVIDYNPYYYKPDRGQNQYNLSHHLSYASFNYDLCYDNVYNDPTISTYIYGHHLGTELCYGHTYPLWDIYVPSLNDWCGDCDNQFVRRADYPPQILSDALTHFYLKRGNSNQKLIYGAAVHFGNIDGFKNPGHLFKPSDYIKMEGVTNLQKPDVFVESSYNAAEFRDWETDDGNNPSNDYLGKFKSIDLAKRYFKNVISELDFEQFETNQYGLGYIYEIHSNPSVPNGNRIWWLAYTSIIHGAMGVIFYSLNDAYRISEPDESSNKNYANNPYNTDRFSRDYFPKIYKNYISNLSKELRYLVNQNLLSDDPNSIVYNKTTSADVNGILDPSTTYLPSVISTADGRDISAINTVFNNPTKNTYPNNFRGEDHGIRYTVRTNGIDVIMIACNPNPYSIHSVSFNLGNVANPIMRNASSVDVLFDDGNISSVNSTNYKITRSGTINSSNTSVLKKYNIPFNYSGFSCDFGPFDVKVFKFNSSRPTNTDNAWTKVWTNHGSGIIGGVGPVNTNFTFIPMDVDGDLIQELLCVTNGVVNSWVVMLKYNSTKNSWDWYWSNNGNGLIGQDWSLNPTDKFYTGDFNKDGKDELLIFRNNNSWINMYTFVNGQWNWYWSNYGNGNLITNWIQNDARYYIGDFDGDTQKEIISLSTVDSRAKMFKYNNNNWYSVWSNGSSSNFADAWPVTNSSNYYVGNFNGDATDDLFSVSGTWAIYMNYANNKWNWSASNNGINSLATWPLPFSSTDKILTSNVDNDNLTELMFIKRGTSANLAQTADYSGSTLTKRWSTSTLINDWPIADGVGKNTNYCFIKVKSNEPAYLLCMRSYGNSNIYLINMYKSTNGSFKAGYLPINDSSKALESLDSEITIYPNPSDGNFIVNFSNQIEDDPTFTLMNTFGQLVYQKKYQNLGQNKITVNCNVPSGIYFYKIRSSSMYKAGSLIIK